METTSGQDLKKELEELYIYYFGEVRKRSEQNEDREMTERDNDFYMEGKFSGGMEAVSAIYLSLFGGEETMQLWNSALAKFAKGETGDDKTTGS